MFKLPGLKLYRKFLILAVLSGSLLAFSSFNQAATLPYCCPLWHHCDEVAEGCFLECAYIYPPTTTRYQQCITACENANFQCYIDAEPCNHDCEY
jgi:hypothetical protein